MDKQKTLLLLEKTWGEFKESFAGLSDAQLTQAGVSVDWSVKDILAHVSTWEEEALKYLPVILQGKTPPRYRNLYGGIDPFNAQMTARKSSLSLSEILKQLDETHRLLINYLNSIPEDQFTQNTRFSRRLRADALSHYPLHAKAIRAWREQFNQ